MDFIKTKRGPGLYRNLEGASSHYIGIDQSSISLKESNTLFIYLFLIEHFLKCQTHLGLQMEGKLQGCTAEC